MEGLKYLGILIYIPILISNISFYAIPAITITLVFFKAYRQMGWLKMEIFFVFVPFIFWCSTWARFVLKPLDPTQIPQTLGNISHGYLATFLCGVIGGLVLAPRLFIQAKTKHKKLYITSYSAAIACVLVLQVFRLLIRVNS